MEPNLQVMVGVRVKVASLEFITIRGSFLFVLILNIKVSQWYWHNTLVIFIFHATTLIIHIHVVLELLVPYNRN